MTSIFMAMIQLFLILIVGWVAQKCRLFPEGAQAAITKLVLYIATPCTILYSVLNNNNLPGVGVMVELLLVSTACYVAVGLLSLLAVWLMRVPQGSRGTYVCMLLFSNCGFIGFPVVQAIFGSDAVFYNSIVGIPFYPLLYIFGVYMLIRDSAWQGGEQKKLELKWTTFASPCVVASLLAVAFAIGGWKLPGVITDTIGTIGGITTPGALVVIGISIAKQPLRLVLGSPRIYIMTALRLVVFPALVWFVLHFFLTDPVLLGVIVVVFAMPTATAITMLAGEYGADEPATVQGAFVTTVLSMITIPVLVSVLM